VVQFRPWAPLPFQAFDLRRFFEILSHSRKKWDMKRPGFLFCPILAAFAPPQLFAPLPRRGNCARSKRLANTCRGWPPSVRVVCERASRISKGKNVLGFNLAVRLPDKQRSTYCCAGNESAYRHTTSDTELLCNEDSMKALVHRDRPASEAYS
jgi:hypothetical protein